MKKITIIIEREELERIVGENTAYTGVKMEDGSEPGVSLKVATVGEDAQLLSRLLQDSASIVGERLKEFVREQVYDGRRLVIWLETGSSYDESGEPFLRAALLSALAGFMTARWFRLAMPPKAGEWEEEGKRQLGIAERNLFHKRRPVRGER